MVTFKGNVTNAVGIADVTISETPPTVLFAIAVRLVTSVASVVAVTVLNVDGDVARVIGTNFVANVVVAAIVVVDGSRVVDNNVLAVVGCNVDTMAFTTVAIVVLTGASVAMNGNCGQGCLICGPSILSKT